jgi:hypothetical protein
VCKLKMEVISSFEAFVDFQRTARHHIPEDRTLQATDFSRRISTRNTSSLPTSKQEDLNICMHLILQDACQLQQNKNKDSLYSLVSFKGKFISDKRGLKIMSIPFDHTVNGNHVDLRKKSKYLALSLCESEFPCKLSKTIESNEYIMFFFHI